jgi:hypothetical protein
VSQVAQDNGSGLPWPLGQGRERGRRHRYPAMAGIGAAARAVPYGKKFYRINSAVVSKKIEWGFLSSFLKSYIMTIKNYLIVV